MNTPKPTEPIPIYGGEVEVPDIYIDGVRQTPKVYIKPLYGELDVNTGIFTYYGKKGGAE